MPNTIPTILVAATLNVAHAILVESHISFLGFGVQTPTPSWGNMLNPGLSGKCAMDGRFTGRAYYADGVEGGLDLLDIRSRSMAG